MNGSTIRVEIASLIGIANQRSAPLIHSGEAAKVLRDIYAEVSEKGKDIDDWGRTIRAAAIIPKDHPFPRLCDRLNLPKDHALRTLGAWAFGFGNPWIVIHYIQVANEPPIDRSVFDPGP